jgi:molybdate transport system substrate-binding protein
MVPGTARAVAGLPSAGGRRRRRWLALIGACLLAAAGPKAAGAEILVASAVSLREPLTEIAARYAAQGGNGDVRLTFAGSSALAAQVRMGAPIDVLVSADERIVDELARQHLLDADSRIAVATNRIVVMVSKGVTVPIKGPDDLLRPEIRRIAVPQFAVPVGRYAREWLRRRGLLEALEPRLVPTEHARATLAAVDHGQADAAIVYATDARLAESARIAFEVPPAEQPHIVYAAARVEDSRHRAGADAFLAFLGSEAARSALRAAGFAVPSEPR